jgi:DNA (cytosine-5)-methyltransferase 1
VVIENVRGILSAPAHCDVELCTWCVGDADREHLLRALGAVLGDLADLGFDAEWIGLPASHPAVGACHERWREFILAWRADADPNDLGRDGRPGNLAEAGGRNEPANRRHDAAATAEKLRFLPTPAARDWKSGASNLMERNSRPLNEVVVNLLPTPLASDGGLNRGSSAGWGLRNTSKTLDAQWIATDGTDYGPAIRRWEPVIGRPAPCPTEPGARGKRRLSPVFSEWLIGAPEGHITAVPDLDRRAQLRAIGNGVVWQQGAHALRVLHARATHSVAVAA